MDLPSSSLKEEWRMIQNYVFLWRNLVCPMSNALLIYCTFFDVFEIFYQAGIFFQETPESTVEEWKFLPPLARLGNLVGQPRTGFKQKNLVYHVKVNHLDKSSWDLYLQITTGECLTNEVAWFSSFVGLWLFLVGVFVLAECKHAMWKVILDDKKMVSFCSKWCIVGMIR